MLPSLRRWGYHCTRALALAATLLGSTATLLGSTPGRGTAQPRATPPHALIYAQRGTPPALYRSVRDAVVAQLGSVSIQVATSKTLAAPVDTAAERLAQARTLAQQLEGQAPVVVFEISGRSASEARLHIVDLLRGRSQTRELATGPDTLSAAAAAAGIIARESALAILAWDGLSQVDRSAEAPLSATTTVAGGDDDGVGQAAQTTAPIPPIPPVDTVEDTVEEATSARPQNGRSATTAAGGVEQPNSADQPSEAKTSGIGATTGRLAQQPPEPANSPPRRPPMTSPDTSDDGETQPTDALPTKQAPEEAVEEKDDITELAEDKSAAAHPGGFLLLGAALQVESPAPELQWQTGLALKLQYNLPTSLPLLAALEGSIIPETTLGERPLQIRLKRWPIAALMGAHIEWGPVRLQAAAGAIMEVWLRETVQDQDLMESPESGQTRFGALLQGEVRFPLNPFAELQAGIELSAFPRRVRYLGDSGGQEVVLLRSSVAIPRFMVGGCLRIP